MNYELGKRLKDAGFKQIGKGYIERWDFAQDEPLYVPTLSELIEACGATTNNSPWGDGVGAFEFCLQFSENEWKAGYTDPNYHESWSYREEGATPEEAVAELWLALNKTI